ncbi:NAD-P-binding protein [Peniophora sp. CONT]|nr:NAD-P-binding protein [Peniophora sp. CONT]
MPGYKNFAVVGAGGIGGAIIEELLNSQSTGAVDKIVLLTRPESASKHEALAARGVTIARVDYSSSSEVSKALAGVEVVICTLSHNALGVQLPVAEAAKAAGAQLFVPTDFGSPTDDATEGVHLVKEETNKNIRALGLPTARFFTGVFSDGIWVPYLNLDLKSGSVGVGGDGNAKASFTSCIDIARYVVYVLATLSPSETKNKTFRIEGERASFNEIFAAYEKKHGVKLQVKYTPISELEENLKKNPRDIVSNLHLVGASGKSTVGSPIDNDLFPAWNPKPVIHYL